MGFASLRASVETTQGKPQTPAKTQVNDTIHSCVSVLKIAALHIIFDLPFPPGLGNHIGLGGGDTPPLNLLSIYSFRILPTNNNQVI